MNKILRFFCLVLCLICLLSSVSYAEFQFSDTRFQGDFTTENLDRIINEYELFDGWYWTTEPWIVQNFHGREDTPGWTDTAVNRYNRKKYIKGYYGCRWMSNKVFPENSNYYGYGECFGFASFIGYLLSGDFNPHKNWTIYRSLDDTGGLKVGDILRTEFTANGKKYNHSAVVYSVSEDEVLFFQVSGSAYNQIIVASGYLDGYHNAPVLPEELAKLPNIKICRSQLNTGP